MVRSFCFLTLLAAVLGSGLGWGQQPPYLPAAVSGAKEPAEPAKPAAPPTPIPEGQPEERFVTVQEPGKPSQVCRILREWRTPEGALAREVQALDTGEKMTIIEIGGSSDNLEAYPTIRSQGIMSRVIRWGRNMNPPPGVPVPPTSSASAPPEATVASQTAQASGDVAAPATSAENSKQSFWRRWFGSEEFDRDKYLADIRSRYQGANPVDPAAAGAVATAPAATPMSIVVRAPKQPAVEPPKPSDWRESWGKPQTTRLRGDDKRARMGKSAVKVEQPKVEQPKAELPKAELPKTTRQPKAELPKTARLPKAEQPKVELPKKASENEAKPSPAKPKASDTEETATPKPKKDLPHADTDKPDPLQDSAQQARRLLDSELSSNGAPSPLMGDSGPNPPAPLLPTVTPEEDKVPRPAGAGAGDPRRAKDGDPRRAPDKSPHPALAEKTPPVEKTSRPAAKGDVIEPAGKASTLKVPLGAASVAAAAPYPTGPVRYMPVPMVTLPALTRAAPMQQPVEEKRPADGNAFSSWDKSPMPRRPPQQLAMASPYRMVAMPMAAAPMAAAYPVPVAPMPTPAGYAAPVHALANPALAGPIMQAAYSPYSHNPMPMPAYPSTVLDPQFAIQLLQTLRESIYPSQREWSVETLASMDCRAHPQVFEAILTAAKEDPAPTVRACCVRSLAALNMNPTLVGMMLQSMKSDTDPRVRYEVEQVLARMPRSK